jgi:hypothetical protein
MTVLRIVANIAADTPGEVQTFYTDLFGLCVLMDFGWIVTLGSEERATTQVNLMSEGGSGTPVPRFPLRSTTLTRFMTTRGRWAAKLNTT